MHGRTTFIVAHRPATLAACDLLLQVGADGRVRAVPGSSRASLGLPARQVES
jgi:hypothetical protein